MKEKKGLSLVIGASLKPERYSYQAIIRLRANAWPTVALGLREGVVADVQIHTDIKEFRDLDIDTFTLYLGPARQGELLKWAKMLRPKRIIFNPGTENLNIYKDLDALNIKYEEACTLVLLATAQYDLGIR